MNTKASIHIEIPRRAVSCAHCLQLFQPGMEYFSRLMDQVKEGSYVRSDYHIDCWKQIADEPCSLWKGKIPLKREPSELPKQRDARSLYLLKEALAICDPKSYPEAFVLSLYLARRRKIILRQERLLNDGHPALLYEIMATEEMILVPKLALSDLQVKEIQLALAAKFTST